MRGTGEVPSALSIIIATRQPHRFGRVALTENNKSP